jgi:2'-5' RNA ligase
LFVSVEPSSAVLDQLSSVVATARASSSSSPGGAGVRWAGRDTWHMTLRFLGEVDDPAPVVEALSAASLPAVTAALGPTVDLLGKRVVMVPVTGLDDLAASVVKATAELGEPPEDRGFRGHLTLGRLSRLGRSGRPPQLDFLGMPVTGEWQVDELTLVQSHLGDGPARYENLFRRPLDA